MREGRIHACSYVGVDTRACRKEFLYIYIYIYNSAVWIANWSCMGHGHLPLRGLHWPGSLSLRDIRPRVQCPLPRLHLWAMHTSNAALTLRRSLAPYSRPVPPGPRPAFPIALQHLGLVYAKCFWILTLLHFVFIWQILFNYRVTRFERFVLWFTGKLCN